MRYLLILLLAFSISNASCIDGHLYENYDSGNSLLPDNTIRVLETAPDGKVWVGTDNGLVVIENDNWTVYQSTNSPLPDDGIRSIAFDAAGNPWIGTFQGGVTSIQDTGWLVYDILNSPLPDNHIRAIDFDTSGHFWLGTIGGVATLQDTGWTFFNNSNAPFTVDNVATIFITEDDTKWFGTVNGGLLRLQTGVWSRFDHNNSTLPDNTVLDITFGPDSSIWLAQPAGGLTLYTPGTGFNNFNTINSNIPSNTIRYLHNDTLGGLLAASGDKGMLQYYNNDIWSEYSYQENPDTNLNYLLTNDLLSVTRDTSYNVWIGTNGQGLIKMRYTTSIDPPITSAQSPLQDFDVIPYPNPFIDEVNILVNEPAHVDVFNMNGQLITQHELTLGENKIPLGDLPKGIYVLKLSSEKGYTTRRITKQ